MAGLSDETRYLSSGCFFTAPSFAGGGRIPVTFWTDGSQGCFAADRSSIWYVKLDKFVEEINYDDGG